MRSINTTFQAGMPFFKIPVFQESLPCKWLSDQKLISKENRIYLESL